MMISTVVLFAATATAGEAEFYRLLEMLLQNGTLTQQQYDSLRGALDDDGVASEALEAEAPRVAVDTAGGLEVSTDDGAFSFGLGGRLMIDSAFYREDTNDLGDGTELRRTRLEAEGMLFSDYAYELGVDFAGSDADVKDAFIEYLGLWPATIRVGQFKEPFSLEELTSSKYMTFMERALPNALAPGRHIGIGLGSRGSGWTAAGGVFGESFDDDVSDEGDEGWGITGRVTYAPWREDRRALHFGAALSHRVPDETKEIELDTRPESHITDVRYLNTGRITDVSHLDLAGLEAAWVEGPFSLQGEYVAAAVDRGAGQSNLAFDGWYLYGSWLLTGESRNYKPKAGKFGRIRPIAPGGAWELALRYSSLDLNDDDVAGGRAGQMTVGLNWYLNAHTRLMANYIRVDNDANADDDGDVAGDDDPRIIQLRAQIDF
ncbi:OprO/OprP family phosphate-selective porin [Thiorhodococcus minor]|nr:OprO/OprP family phosphate-selective porin [Thiorhodococcus minor]